MAELSEPARLALKSLCDHPHLDTPDAVAGGPYSVEEVGTPEIGEGLAELEAQGLAREEFGSWLLTDRGRERCG
jgi:hypothetical protein